MTQVQGFLVAASLSIFTVLANSAQAAVTTYNTRTSWQSAVGAPQTITFSTDDSGNPITNPPSDQGFSSLTFKGVTFLNVHSFNNSVIYTTTNAILHVDLPTNTTAFGTDLSPFVDSQGTYAIRLSTGEVFTPAAGTIPQTYDFFGVKASTPISWVEFSLDSTYLTMDNFSFVSNAVLQVRIDIKPDASDNQVNPVNPGSNGVIPVSIISTSTFNATTLELSSIRFGRAGTEAAISTYTFKDSNGDGLVDVIANFKTQSTGIRCGDTVARLTGKTKSGQMISGFDSIRTVGCH